ncbi:MAG: RNA polymerase sigma factor [Phycisphaerales bacterium]
MIQGKEPTDDDIDLSPAIRAARAGDPSAWKFLVDRYSRRIFGLVFARCHSVEIGEEITQSVLATVSAKLMGGEYTDDGRFEAWIFRIAINRLRDLVRRNRIRPDTPAGDALEELAQGQIHERHDNEEHSRLRRALEALSESDRDVVLLRHHGGLSFKQISELLDEPMGTLLARHHRALKKLKELMESDVHPEASPRSGFPVRGT